ncbi:transposase, partial [Acidaminococcus sp.]
MAKYGYRFKKKLVLEYLKNRESYSYISRKYGIASDSQLRTWVAAYKSFG